MHTALVICPHADDAAAFCGGTVAKLAADGWRVVLVRVTDDSKDSVGVGSVEQTIRVNTEELAVAARLLGVADVVELGYPTDTLGDVSRVALRERFVYLFRKYRPYAVLSFDPFGLFEGNLDHIVTAQAVEEAYWVACFDLHHPEHFEQGHPPFAVCERWYYGRSLPEVNHYEDVTDHIETKVQALCAHRAMMRNQMNMLRLQLETWGRRVPEVDHAVGHDLAPLLGEALRVQARAAAARAGMAEGRFAEAWRLVRFGGWERLLQERAQAVAAGAPVRRAALDRHW